MGWHYSKLHYTTLNYSQLFRYSYSVHLWRVLYCTLDERVAPLEQPDVELVAIDAEHCVEPAGPARSTVQYTAL